MYVKSSIWRRQTPLPLYSLEVSRSYMAKTSTDLPSAAARWDDALSRARSLTSQMTLEELNNVTYGISSTCSGLSGSVPRLGWDGLCMNDAGQGVRGTDLVNAYTEGVSVGASWNVELAYERARYMGAEFRRKGG